jgi:hypothetical protein
VFLIWKWIRIRSHLYPDFYPLASALDVLLFSCFINCTLPVYIKEVVMCVSDHYSFLFLWSDYCRYQIRGVSCMCWLTSLGQVVYLYINSFELLWAESRRATYCLLNIVSLYAYVVTDFVIARCIIFISLRIIGSLTSPAVNTKRKSIKAIYVILRIKH